jgi:hypothetical protein
VGSLPLTEIPQRTAKLFEDDDAMDGLTAEQISDLKNSLEQVSKLCQQLADFAIPMSIIHGDHFPANTAEVKGQLIVLIGPGPASVTPSLTWSFSTPRTKTHGKHWEIPTLINGPSSTLNRASDKPGNLQGRCQFSSKHSITKASSAPLTKPPPTASPNPSLTS